MKHVVFVKDFWKLLDPHEVDKSSSLKPFKSGTFIEEFEIGSVHLCEIVGDFR